MEFIRKTIKVGNSAGVILPKTLLGSEVKIIVVKRPVNIKKEVLSLLSEFLKDLRGIYILNEKPIEILAVSSRTKTIIENEKMKISIVPYSIVKRDIKTKINLKEKLLAAKTILNESLLSELKREIRTG